MASINYGAREISVKVVYYGPGLSGKTTNLQVVHKKVPKGNKSNMVSLATETDRTLFFDFLPLDLGKIKGFSTKFQLYTVPGQVYYNATRKLVLRGVDGVVFVADSSRTKMNENLESFQNLLDNLSEYGYDHTRIPMVIQYNKRDLADAMPVQQLDQAINRYHAPSNEAVAVKGQGVFESLKMIGKMVIDELNRKYSRRSSTRSAMTSRAQQGPPTPPPSQAAPQQRPATPPPPPPPPPRPQSPLQDDEPFLSRPGPSQQPPPQQPPSPPQQAWQPGPQQPEPDFSPPPQSEPPRAAPSQADYGTIDLEPMSPTMDEPAAGQQTCEQQQPAQGRPEPSDGNQKTDLDLEIEKYQKEIESRQGTSPGQQGFAPPQQGAQGDSGGFETYSPPGQSAGPAAQPPQQPPQFEGFPQQGDQAGTEQYGPGRPDTSRGYPPRGEEDDAGAFQGYDQPQQPRQEGSPMYFTSVNTNRRKTTRRPVNPKERGQKGLFGKLFGKKDSDE